MTSLTAGRPSQYLGLLQHVGASTNGPFQTERTMSGVPYFFRLWRLRRMNLLVDLFERVFLPLVGLPRGHRVAAARGAAFAAAVRMVDRVHRRRRGHAWCQPRQRAASAPPCRSSSGSMWSGFDTAPMVATAFRPCTSLLLARRTGRTTGRSPRPGRRTGRRSRRRGPSARPCRPSARRCGRSSRPACRRAGHRRCRASRRS